MQLRISKNGTQAVEDISVVTAPELAALLNSYIDGKLAVIDGNAAEALEMLRGLDPDTSRSMGYAALTMLREEKARTNRIAADYGIHVLVALAMLNRHSVDGKPFGMMSLENAAKAHRDFGLSALEEALKARNLGMGIYHAARQYSAKPK